MHIFSISKTIVFITVILCSVLISPLRAFAEAEELYSTKEKADNPFIFQQLYYDANSNKHIIIVPHTSPELKNSVWTKNESGWLIQSNNQIIFTNETNKSKAIDFIEGTLNRKISLIHFFITPAWAQSTCGFSTQQSSKISVNQNLCIPSVMSSLAQCSASAFNGVKNSLNSTADNLNKLITNPLGFFDDLSKQVNNLLQFTKNIKRELTNLQAALSEMTPAQSQQMFCSWLGSLGTDTLSALLTGGATSVLLAKSLLSLQKFTKIITSAFRLKRLGINNKYTDPEFLKRMNKCAI